MVLIQLHGAVIFVTGVTVAMAGAMLQRCGTCVNEHGKEKKKFQSEAHGRELYWLTTYASMPHAKVPG